MLLLDEVDAALDESNQSLLANLLTGITATTTTSGRAGSKARSSSLQCSQVLCVSHAPAFQQLCGRVVKVSRGPAGTTVAEGSGGEVAAPEGTAAGPSTKRPRPCK